MSIHWQQKTKTKTMNVLTLKLKSNKTDWW